MKRILLACLVLVVGSAPAFAQETPEKNKGVVVPFKLLKSGHMTVTVKINDKGPYQLVFDTGAPITLVSTRVAKDAELLKGQPKPLFAPFGTMGEAKIRTLQVGDQMAKNQPAVVMDHPAVEALGKAFGRLDGIVGYPFFAQFTMTLDYQAKTMTFVPNGYKPGNVMQSMMTAMLSGSGGPKVLSPQVQLGIVAKKGDTESGLTITRVLKGSPADKAGLKVGDVMLTLDDRWTDSMEDLFRAAGHLKPGTTTSVKISRDGKETKVTITPTAGL